MPSSVPEAFARYVRAWVDRDESVLPQVLAEPIHYIESHGPAYRGLDQVLHWFRDWNDRGEVLEWTITDHVGEGDSHACRWRFTSSYDGATDTFDGVTWFILDGEGKILELLEFAATLPTRYPYGEG